MFEHITANEIAGYTVGALLLTATISAPKIDSFISSSQRRSLGMCNRCGDLKMIACSKCKGSGFVKEGGPFSLILPIFDDGPPDPVYRVKANNPSSPSCRNCGAKGHFPCPQCSEVLQA